MAANGRMTRTLARYQSTYEDAAREIQKRITTCREAFHEAKDFYEDYPLNASDTNTQRKSQLLAQYRANITQLNQHAVNLGAATSEWTALMRDYTIATEESERAENMRSQHDDFFMQAPNLDFELHELIALYQNALHRVQPPSHSPSPSPELGMGVQPTLLAPTGSALQMAAQSNSDNGTDSASTDTAASNGVNGASSEGTPVPAYSAGQDTRRESPRMQDFDARPAAETTAFRPASRQVHFRDPPAEIETFSNRSLIDDDFSLDQRFYDPPPSQNAVEDRSANSTPQQTDHRSPVVESMNRLRFDNSPSYGMFTQSDGLVTKTTPMHDLRDAQPPPAGRGRVDAPTYASAATAPIGPTPAARTTQPAPSAASTHYRPPSAPIDHGADFGRENASRYYQTAIATYQRTTSSKPPPLVLKELPIQKFSGEIRTYPVFKNRFIETVGGRSDLEPRHKFQYLLQCLDGEPLRLANGYLTTDTNYLKILDRLEERYGDKFKLLNLLAQDLINMKPVSQNTSDLRRFHDEALRLADEMEQLGSDVDDNVVWKQVLISKIPQSLRNKIYENMRKDPLGARVHEILASVADYLRMLESGKIALSWNVAADGNSVRSGRPHHSDPRSTTHRAGNFATDADATYAANVKPRRTRKCAYCGRDHWASQCDIYVSHAQRYRRARQLNYCLLCLRAGHWIGTCPKRTTEECKHCHDGQHHRSLCKTTFRKELRPFASLRHSPVRAITPGVQGLLKTEHGSSSQQESRDTTSVSQPGAPEPPPAKTVRFPSAHLNSVQAPSNSKKPRRKKSKGLRTDPKGRDGTTRPTTASVAENVKQMDASACGGDGLLSGHSSNLTTDRRSTTAEAPWDDRTLGYGSGTMLGLPDTPRECAPWADEEASLPPSPGHCSDADTEPSSDEQDDADPWFAPANALHDYAVSTTSPADNHAVLLECLRTNAVNLHNSVSRPAIVFLDSGSTSSYISMKLAQELQLPCLEKRLMRVNAFGTNIVTTITGFATTVLLRSRQGGSVALVLTASDRIVPPVTAALVNDEEVALLQENKCAIIST